MAGKHIYIETILDNLLGGFQTTFDKMIAALDRMIGKTEEDPDGTSLKQVVTSVESLMGDNEDKKNLYDVVSGLDTMTGKLEQQVTELQKIVSTTAAGITKLLISNIDPTDHIEIYNEELTQDYHAGSVYEFSKTTTLSVKSNANGILNISAMANKPKPTFYTGIDYYGICTVGLTLEVKDKDGNAVTPVGNSNLTYSYDKGYGNTGLTIEADDIYLNFSVSESETYTIKFIIYFRLDARSSSQAWATMPPNWLSMNYGVDNILKPGGAITISSEAH